MMCKHQEIIKIGWVSCIWLLGGWVWTQDEKTEPLAWAKPYVTPEVLTFQPEGEFERFYLTLRGQGIVLQSEFSGLSVPFLEPLDDKGEPLPDGSYVFELSADPVVKEKRKLPVLSQTGSFRIHQGLIMVLDKKDPMVRAPRVAKAERDDPTEDQVIVDDLIVVGNACIGLDCVNGQVFTFETLLLKENNTRIKFEDTSTTGGFATNDWQIGANESPFGGAETFFIEDLDGATIPFIIEAAAPNNSLYVDSLGSVGLGTGTPGDSLHVTRSDGTTSAFIQETSATTANRTLLKLTNQGDVRVNISGDSGVTNWQLRSGSVIGFEISRLGSGVKEFAIQPSGDVEFGGPGAPFFEADSATGDVNITGAFNSISDRAKKENLEPVDPREVLEKVARLPLSTWNYRHQADSVRHMGPMAQDFYTAFGLGANQLTISATDLPSVALAALQGLNQRLESEIEQKDAVIRELTQRLEALEKRVASLGQKHP